MKRKVAYQFYSLSHSVAEAFVLTRGERKLVYAYAMVCLFGAGIGYLTVAQMNGGHLLAGALNAYHKWIILSAALGAGLALFVAGHRMGHAGLRGIVPTITAILQISVVAPLIGGTLALPFYGTMFGPFTMGVMMVGSPILALCWFANLLAAHLLISEWRAEQDRLFARLA